MPIDTTVNLTEEEKKAKKDARKAKNLKNWNETMGIIDATTTALNNYPELNDIGMDFNLSFASNPLVFLFTIFKHMKGYDEFLKVFSSIITPLCKTLEYSVKSVFMARLTELLSCTLSNMRISEEIINNGFTINLKDVDLLNILLYSPLPNENTSSIGINVKKRDKNGNPIINETFVGYDENGNEVKKREFVYEEKSTNPVNIGKYYYFGCDDFDKADDLVLSQDFNAVLWYVKNRANGRVVWYGYKNQPFGQLANELDSHTTNGGPSQQKRDGILTLEYHDNGKSLIKADGTPYFLQSPSENCLHVFIGNTREMPTDSNIVINKEANYKELKKYENLISEYNKLLDEINKKYKQLNSVTDINETYSDYTIEGTEKREKRKALIKQFKEDFEKGEKTVDEILSGHHKSYLNKRAAFLLEGDLQFAVFKNELLSHSLNGLKSKILEYSATINVIEHNDIRSYRPANQNYYYDKFLMTFNSDYIWSVKLFDEKVVAAQLIDALTGCLSVNADLSLEARILRSEVESLVEEVNSDDSYDVSDCFFTFTNSGYNDLLEKAELAQMGLYSLNGSITSIDYAEAQDILTTLDGIGEKVDNSSIIENSIYRAALSRTKELDVIDISGSGVISVDFVENLMNKLATVIVTSVVSPKLYIMLLVNFQVMKLNTHFDIIKFINSYKQILLAIIRDVRDQLVNVFTEKVMEFFKDMIKQLGSELVMEQIQYYKNLIMKCIGCINVSKRGNDWTMAQVDYADIETPEEELTQDDNNC